MTAVLLDGIVLGLQFGLLGAGLTIVYGIGGVLNLAYGPIAVTSAIVVSVAKRWGAPAVPAVLLGILTGAALGLLLNATLMRPVYRQHGDHRVLLSLLLTIGVAFILNGLLVWRLPLESLGLNVGGEPVSILGVPMRMGSIFASAITILAGGSLIFLFRVTTAGKAVR